MPEGDVTDNLDDFEMPEDISSSGSPMGGIASLFKNKYVLIGVVVVIAVVAITLAIVLSSKSAPPAAPPSVAATPPAPELKDTDNDGISDLIDACPDTESDIDVDETGCDESEVVMPECGDGVKAGSEACDGEDLGAKTCITEGFASGELACNAECTGFDTTSCVSSPGTSAGPGSDSSSTTTTPTGTKVDLTSKTSEVVNLAAAGSVDFELVKGETHKVTVKSVAADSATVEVLSEPISVTLKVGKYKELDLDWDLVKDVNITLKEISASGQAKIELKKVTRPPKCRDTDRGNDPFIAGNTSDGVDLMLDMCVDGSNSYEYYCLNDEISVEQVNCKYGCVTDSLGRGACKQWPDVARDSDADATNPVATSKSYFVKGVCEGKIKGGGNGTDECRSENQLREFYLDATDPQACLSLFVYCAYGCKRGACLPEPKKCGTLDWGISARGYYVTDFPAGEKVLVGSNEFNAIKVDDKAKISESFYLLKDGTTKVTDIVELGTQGTHAIYAEFSDKYAYSLRTASNPTGLWELFVVGDSNGDCLAG